MCSHRATSQRTYRAVEMERPVTADTVAGVLVFGRGLATRRRREQRANARLQSGTFSGTFRRDFGGFDPFCSDFVLAGERRTVQKPPIFYGF
jgi:hypothetical protein